MRIIDAHVHLGCDRETKYYSERELWRDLREAEVDGAVIFAFPEDIYRVKNDVNSRLKANEYILEVSKRNPESLYPFYFVWNDYLIPDNIDEYLGVKWHRHYDEPRYDYEDPRCKLFLETVRDLGMPVLLEEEFHETRKFIHRNPDVNIIIPHMGKLNGGYEKMREFFDMGNVYFDTSTAPLNVIREFLDAVGPERVIFGSDVSGTPEPFYNFPKVELEKLRKLDLERDDLRLILSGNIERLIRRL
ncbi:MAG TPA: hypothetical protein ENF56_02135 [Candidatus Bathyarchaeota archaeon]|nr:hypothetical protein [Candidatus Bathyarchaeota archaeon]